MAQAQNPDNMETNQNSDDDILSASEKRMLELITKSVNFTIKASLKEQISEVQNELKQEIQLNFGKQDQKISQIENDYKSLQEKYISQKHYIEQLELQCRAKNLIFLDIEDFEDESDDELRDSVNTLIGGIVENHGKIDIVHRLGVFQDGKNRPVRVKFERESDRNEIFANRDKLELPNVIKSDTPDGMRVDHALLFGKQEELRRKGTVTKINFKKRTLETDAGILFNASEGMLRDADQNLVASASKARGIKRSKTNPSGRFLGKGNSQNIPSPQPPGKTQTEPIHTPTEPLHTTTQPPTTIQENSPENQPPPINTTPQN